jgi:O-antigen/teichoic acid export membrane protein
LLSQLKRLGADSLLYAFMNVGTKLIAFLMLPIYTGYLTVAEYGVLDIMDRITSMLIFLVIFGTDSALSFYYFDTKNEHKKLEYVRTVMYFRLFIVFILFMIAVVFGEWLAIEFFDNASYQSLFYWGAGVLFFDTMVVVMLMVFRFDFKTIRVVIFTVLKMLLIAVISYLIIRFLNRSPEGVLVGRMVSNALVFFMLLVFGWKYFKPTFSFQAVKEILKYAAPLVPASLAFWIIANSNAFFIKHYGTLEDVGIYGAATKFATVITLLTSGVQMAWRPYSMSIKDKEDSPVLFSKVYYLILLVGIFGVMAIATVMPWLIQILDPNYSEAYKYVALVSAATFLNFYYLIISVGLFIQKRTSIISYTFGIVGVVNIILNILLIPPFGVWGAVAAYLLSYLSAITFIFNRSQKLYFVPVSFLKMSLLFLSMILSVVGIIYIQETAIPDGWILAGWIFLIAVILVSRVDKDIRKRKEVSV